MVPLFSSVLANADLDLVSPLQRVLNRAWFILGEEVGRFEEEFASYHCVDHCVSVANGTDALEIALRALGVGAGDLVVTVANAGFYSSTAIHATGAIPLYIDIDPDKLTLNVSALKAAMQYKPAAVVATHLYGQLADIEEVVRIASFEGVPVVEDCAQSHGARRRDKLAGTFGTIGCFSFYPTKNLGALGDGGALLTGDARLASRARQLRQYGWEKKYSVALQGGRNSRLDEMQAAILRTKLPYLDSWNSKRRAIAKLYNEAFSPFDVRVPYSLGEDYAAHLYVLRVNDRDGFAVALKECGIATDVHYPVPDHKQQAYKVQLPFALPQTELACSTVISLPCFPGMPNGQVRQVIEAVQSYFSKRG